MVSYGRVGAVEYLIVCDGADSSTGVPLAQVAELLLRGVVVDNSKTGDARLKALGLSKGAESKHINTVLFSSIESMLVSRKMKVSSSSGKVRFVTMLGLEYLLRARSAKLEDKTVIQSMIDSCRQVLSSVVSTAESGAVPSQQVLPFLREKSGPPRNTADVFLGAEDLSLRISHLQSVVDAVYNIVSTRHPLAARYRFLPASIIADSFDIEDPASLVSKIQSIADLLISKRKVEGYDVQFGPYPDNEPRYSQRLARLIVSHLEEKGYRVKLGFLRA